MRLDVNLNALDAAVRAMGADSIARTIGFERTQEAWPPIDIQLGQGLDVALSDVDVSTGLLSYEGRQVLLYIQDHRNDVEKALENPGLGRKYHVAYCQTLKEMRTAGRFERYVATNDLSGEFYITGVSWESRQPVDGTARLNVCKHCLSGLNYKNYRNNRMQVFKAFELNAFFTTYSSYFPYMPKRRAGTYDGNYPSDWTDIAASVKRARRYVCEGCKVNLDNDRDLLHVHHLDGVKTNNGHANLKALCADCHRKQVNHEHMYVSRNDTSRIQQLRKVQRIMKIASWEDAIKYADPGVIGLMHLLKNEVMAVPDIAHEVRDATGAVIAEFQIAWPTRRKGIAIAQEDLAAGRAAGWQVSSVQEELDKRT